MYLPLWACESLGGDWRTAAPLGAAVELLAAAANIFDDLQDRDRQAGPLGSLDDADLLDLGLALVALAFEAVSTQGTSLQSLQTLSEQVQELSAFVRDGALGQRADYHLVVSQASSEGQYFEVVGRKSGAAIGHACAAGALLQTTDDGCVNAFREYGRCVGIAFQISNDIDFLADPTSTKADIRARKLTLPVLYGLACLEGEEGRLLREVYLEHAPVTEDAERRIKAALARRGGLYYARVHENIWRRRALEALASTTAAGPAKGRLEALASPGGPA